MAEVYDPRTLNINTGHMEKLYALMENWSKMTEPEITPTVDIFPLLKYAPEQLLGNWRARGRILATI
jgi:hypothetical protein